MNTYSKLECAKDRFLMKAMAAAILPSYVNMESAGSRQHVYEVLCGLYERFNEYDKLLSEFLKESENV